MTAKNLICIIVDRLHAGMVGAYGNSWIRTPAIDRLASGSFLFDQALIENPQLDQLYHAYWQASSSAGGASLPRILTASGMHTALLSDDLSVFELPTADDFAERTFIEPPLVDRSAEEIQQTQLAVLFDTAAEWLATPRDSFCLWLHASAMAGAWDAPLEFRNRYAEEDDPEPPDFASVPNRLLAADHDPDELLGLVHAYAGQLTLFDMCLGGFLDQLEESGRLADTLVVLISARGFPLGEHLRIGGEGEGLWTETLQIPWLMRFPDDLGSMARSPALVTPADLPLTVLNWLNLDAESLGPTHGRGLLQLIRGEVETVRDRVLMTNGAERAIRTPAWFLRQSETSTVELYAKPSDRWEVNEVANLLPEVTAGLQAALAEHERGGSPDAQPPLDELLVTELD